MARRSTFLSRVCRLLGILLLIAGSSACHPRVPDPLPGLRELPERHFAPTDDGWKLAMYHYPAYFRGPAPPEASSSSLPALPAPPGILATGGEPGTRAPVILCHGLAANHYTFDLTEERSMARFLADRGYDVWLLDLRGHGDSRRPKGVKLPPDGWGFDEYALHDVPAAIHYVQGMTGAPRVTWIGHSMGGMAIYAYLASTGDPAVGGVVAIGSPGSLEFANDLVTLGVRMTRYIDWMPRVASRLGSRLMARISGRIPGGFEETIWHLDNMSPEAARLMFWVGVDNIEKGVSRSFAAMMKEGKLVSRDHAVDYAAGLSRFKAPLLAVAAKLDGLAPPYTVLRIFDQVGSTDKTYELISRANGYSFDYGHVDMVLGDRARIDVYPLVYRWLEAHRAPAAGTATAGLEEGQ